MTDYGYSERRACRLLEVQRALVRYQQRPRDQDDAILARLRELSVQRPRFGYRRLHVLLKRQGLVINRKRVYRLYRLADLVVKRKVGRGKRIRLPGTRVPATRPNERWTMDFTMDNLSHGRRFRTVNIVDEFTRECLAIKVDFSLPGTRVVQVLDGIIRGRKPPAIMRIDNGSELKGEALDSWARKNQVYLYFIDPGKPIQNAFIESFNGRFRDECLNMYCFASLAEARSIIEEWRIDYNRVRPHSALGYLTPAEYAKKYYAENKTRKKQVGIDRKSVTMEVD